MSIQDDDGGIARPRRRLGLAAAAAGLLALGGVGGAVVAARTRATVTMAPATPVAIRSLSSTGIVTVRGRVAETFGSRFVLADQSGHALVELGPEGDGAQLVAAGQDVTVQGRFDRGAVHAAFLVGANGKVTALGPLAPPPRHGPGGPDGPGGPHGPRPGPETACASPPPPGATPPTAAPAAAG